MNNLRGVHEMEPAVEILVCPLLSTIGEGNVLCIAEHCAWYIGPVKKCALYVMGHKGALEMQLLQRPQGGPSPQKL